jgi:hypothetical protein
MISVLTLQNYTFLARAGAGGKKIKIKIETF